MKNLEKKFNNAYCPDCGAQLIPESGCFFCRNCGYSMCKI